MPKYTVAARNAKGVTQSFDVNAETREAAAAKVVGRGWTVTGIEEPLCPLPPPTSAAAPIVVHLDKEQFEKVVAYALLGQDVNRTLRGVVTRGVALGILLSMVLLVFLAVGFGIMAWGAIDTYVTNHPELRNRY